MNVLCYVFIKRQSSVKLSLVANSNLDRGHSAKCLCQLLDLYWPSGAEHGSLPVWVRNKVENLPDIFLEAHVEHPIGFIKHQIGDSSQISVATLDKIEQAPWGRNEYLNAIAESPLLVNSRNATVDSKASQLAYVGVSSRLDLDLHDEFPGRCHDEYNWTVTSL